MHDPRLMGVAQRQRRLPAKFGYAVDVPTTIGRRLARDRGREAVCLAPRRRLETPVGRVGNRGALMPFLSKNTQLRDKRGEALPFDEPHRVVMDPTLAPDGMHGDNFFVLDVRGGECLRFETLEPPGINGGSKRQDL
jgi:hypothetical protein